MYDNDQFLLEMAISNFTEHKLSKTNLIIDQPTIFMAIPDTNVNIWNVIYDVGMLKSNCEGIVVPNRMFKINRKTFNGRIHFLDVKKNLLINKVKGKKFRVVSTFTGIDNVKNKDRKYWFYDLSLYSQSLKFMTERFSELQAAKKFATSITTEYERLKKLNPAIKVECLFIIKNKDGALYNMFEKSRVYFPEKFLQNISFYDNFGLISNANNTIFPMFYKDKGHNKLNFKNINKLKSLIQNSEDKSVIEKESIVGDSIIDKDSAEKKETLNNQEKETIDNIESELNTKKETDEILAKNPKSFSKVISGLKEVKFKADDSNSEDERLAIQIDNKKLSQILRKYNITDPQIVANVKAALDRYIKLKGDKLTLEEAETIVLHAIYSSIYGDDNIKPEYITNPEKLIKKLENTRAHKTPLIFPKNNINNIINPKDIIDIKYTTGAWRQKDEFEKSIHTNVRKLFESYENDPEYPIKIKDISHKYVDDELNRLIRYEITLQNENGGDKEPYKVYLNVPGIVNDRYMKLNGVPYIMPVQQFMKPVTKTVKDDVRILSNYAICTLKLENVKFTPTELLEIINYIQIKYSTLIKSFNKETGELILKNKSIININSNPVYKYKDIEINYDKDELALIDQDGNKIKEGKQEYLYNVLIENIQTINPQDQLGKTTKSNPYISIYLGGLNIPFIIYLWQQKGLLTALNEFGVDYEISNQKQEGDVYTIQTKNGYLIIKPTTRKEKLFCNGLLQKPITKIITNLDDPTEIHDTIDKTYGQSATYLIKTMNKNMIDVITKELLEFEGLPTNFNNLLVTHCVDKLLNDPVDNIADLKVYRARLSEMILNIMYAQVKMSHTEYVKNINLGDENAKINMYADHIITTIYDKSNAGVLNYTEPTNPIDEIFLASKTIKTGPNGIRNKNTFRKTHRTIHESHIGNLGANATSESGNVGLDTAHTLTPAIMNEYGAYGKKDIDSLTPWDTLALNEALIPFINEIDSDRAVLATTH
jgi:hypothetical protein